MTMSKGSFRQMRSITSFGTWLEDARNNGIPEPWIDAVIKVEQRLRASMVVCHGFFPSPTQEATIAVCLQRR